MSRAACTLLLLGAFGLAACTTETVIKERTVKGTAIDHGRALFSDPTASPSTLNTFSCATCHRAEADDEPDRILTGAVLAGAIERPTFWAGQENDLLRAINACRFYFMGAQKPWTADDEEAKALYAYLASLPKATPEAVPFTVVQSIEDLPPGDATRGAAVFVRACRDCHGAVHTGANRISDRAVKLPDEAIADHVGYSTTDLRLVFVEKTRHGAFLGYAGNMPPFSEEVLSDDELADLLSYFDLYE
jgi:thiosulfate dehydrogenase